IRDPFAMAATDGQYNFNSLTQFIAVQRMNMLPALRRADLNHWDIKAFLALARILANQRLSEKDIEDAIRMFSFATNFFGVKSLTQHDKLINLEALGEVERFEGQASLANRFNIGKRFPVQLKLMRLNAIRQHSGTASALWIQELNELYTSHSLSKVHVDARATGMPLDKLRTKTKAVISGPRVSVIVPTFQGGPLLLSALRSLLDQSWKNLEIIVVDDGSGPYYDQYLDQAKNLGQDIKVIKEPQNLGAYSARNTGLRHATGDYITVHDDDDWSHGDKITLQVKHLT